MKPLVKVLAVGLVAAGVGVVAGRMLAPQPKPIPTEPLGRLQYGNDLFAQGKLLPQPVDEMTRYKLETEGQKPFAIVVSCADSRVPPELIFNQGLGDLFVVRVAGNIVNAENLASIEYAVEHLKVPLLVVLGHTHCGAVKAAVSGKHLKGHLPQLVAHIEPVVKRVHATHPHLKGDALTERVIQENVRHTLQTIYQRSAIVRSYYEQGKLKFAGGVYQLREGKVEWLKLSEPFDSSPEEHPSSTGSSGGHEGYAPASHP
ncbi:MAG: carbonic anhydrase [Armatimonadetes bacterium JP3_11]|nr:MAG: carbonic anhydrase [Armatimonadetes bacterium JP3_11]